MDGQDAAGVYFAVRSAFTGDYNYFKYNGQIKITKEAFAIHKNKWQFIELGKKYTDRTLPYALAVNFLHYNDEEMWIDTYLRNFAQHDNLYHAWRRCQENRISTLRQVVIDLCQRFNAGDYVGIMGMFEVDGYRPSVRLSPENIPFPWYWYEAHNNSPKERVEIMTAFYMIDRVYNLFDVWNDKMKDDYTWSEQYKRIIKYRPFFQNYMPLSDINILKTLKSLFT